MGASPRLGSSSPLMTPLTSGDLLAIQQWRYATKQFDATRKIPAATWAALEAALVLTPSSFGLQPWKFIVVEDAALREQLAQHSWGQRQVADSSHLVVFCARNELTEADINVFLARVTEVQDTPAERLAGFRKMLMANVIHGAIGTMQKEWAIRQVYIALGNFMTSCAALGIDTCPMEGFEPGKFDELLGLSALGLSSIALCPAGYRSSSDKSAQAPKVRYAAEEMILRI